MGNQGACDFEGCLHCPAIWATLVMEMMIVVVVVVVVAGSSEDAINRCYFSDTVIQA